MLTAAVFCVLATLGECRGSELLVGATSVSITPDRPVALSGQMHTRISRGVRSPVMAAALALESRDAGKSVDQAILVSCDLVAIDRAVIDRAKSGFAVNVRALDAIHVATAEALISEARGEHLEFWTHDARQALAALSRGLTVRGV